MRPTSKQTYLTSVAAIELFVQYGPLSSHIVQHVEQQRGHLTRLELLDDVLHPLGHRAVQSATLKDWMQQLSDLVTFASAIEADPLRAFVIRHLSSVQWAVQNYDVVGIDGISRAYGAMVAEVVRSQGMAGADRPGAKDWYGKGKKVLVALGISIAASSAVVQQADNLLTHGEHIYQSIGAEDGKGAAGAVGEKNGAEHGTEG